MPLFGTQTREAIFFGQVFDEDVFWQRLASGFKLGDLGAPGCDALAQGSLLLFAEGHGGRIQISGQVNVAKGSDLTLEQSVVSANLSVYFAPGGVNDASSVRKSFGAVLDQAINRVMFTHVLEEILLEPPREHRNGHARQIGLIVGTQDGALVAAFLTTLAHFAHP